MKRKYFEAILSMREAYSVSKLCKAFGVSRSGFYEYENRPVKPASTRDKEDKKAIQELFDASNGTCGAKYIAGTLKAGIVVEKRIINHKRVARLMKEMNIQTPIRRKKTSTEKKTAAAGYVYPNLLERNFDALFPNHKWVMDVTEFKRGEDKIYVSALMDLYDRNPIGVVISRTPDITMVEKTIRKAMKERNLKNLSSVVIHSDQGNLYRSYHYHRLSHKLGFIPSMSRKANCWDNAVIESFFSHFKTELPYHFQTDTAKQLEKAIPKYIKYYKEKRSQKRLGYLPPNAFFATYFECA